MKKIFLAEIVTTRKMSREILEMSRTMALKMIDLDMRVSALVIGVKGVCETDELKDLTKENP